MKNLILILFFLSFISAKADDPPGVDKTKHFYAGFGIAIIGGEITNQIIQRPALSSAIGCGLGIIAGIVKETVYDRAMKKGVYSNDDMFVTSWGSVCGAIVIRVKFDFSRNDQIKKTERLNAAKDLY